MPASRPRVSLRCAEAVESESSGLACRSRDLIKGRIFTGRWTIRRDGAPIAAELAVSTRVVESTARGRLASRGRLPFQAKIMLTARVIVDRAHARAVREVCGRGPDFRSTRQASSLAAAHPDVVHFSAVHAADGYSLKSAPPSSAVGPKIETTGAAGRRCAPHPAHRGVSDRLAGLSCSADPPIASAPRCRSRCGARRRSADVKFVVTGDPVLPIAIAPRSPPFPPPYALVAVPHASFLRGKALVASKGLCSAPLPDNSYTTVWLIYCRTPARSSTAARAQADSPA